MKIKLVIIDTFEREKSKPRINYFFPGNHIDKFTYSPESSNRTIETDFKSHENVYINA